MHTPIEPDLRYCPLCHEEYRSDIVHCADCAVELITGAAMLEQEGATRQGQADHDQAKASAVLAEEGLVALRKGPLLQIKELQHVLARYGVASQARAEEQELQGGRCCGGPTILLEVPASQLQEAVAVLEKEHRRATGLQEENEPDYTQAVFDANAAQATCPACGATFIPSGVPLCPDCGLCFG